MNITTQTTVKDLLISIRNEMKNHSCIDVFADKNGLTPMQACQLLDIGRDLNGENYQGTKQ